MNDAMACQTVGFESYDRAAMRCASAVRGADGKADKRFKCLQNRTCNAPLDMQSGRCLKMLAEGVMHNSMIAARKFHHEQVSLLASAKKLRHVNDWFEGRIN